MLLSLPFLIKLLLLVLIALYAVFGVVVLFQVISLNRLVRIPPLGGILFTILIVLILSAVSLFVFALGIL